MASASPNPFSEAPLDEMFSHSAASMMYWSPRFLIASPAAFHVPFLFWLIDCVQPRHLAVQGEADGMACLALCQALDKLNLPAKCDWYGGWKSPGTTTLRPELPPALTRQAQLYNDLLNPMLQVSPEDALQAVRPASLDMLLVDASVLEEDCQPEEWLARLKETGILLIHRLSGLQGETRGQIEAFLQEQRVIDLPGGESLILVAKGNQHPPRLEKFLTLCAEADMPAALSLFMRRQGEAAAAVARDSSLTGNLQAAKAQNKTAKEEINALRTALEKRGQRLSALQVTAAQTAQDLEAAQAQNQRYEQEQTIRFDEIADLTGKLQAQETALEAATQTAQELQSLRDENQRYKQEQACRFDEIASLTNQIQNRDKTHFTDQNARFEEIANLTKMLETARKQLNQLKTDNHALQEHNTALLNSTSWRLTAPIRALKKMRG